MNSNNPYFEAVAEVAELAGKLVQRLRTAPTDPCNFPPHVQAAGFFLALIAPIELDPFRSGELYLLACTLADDVEAAPTSMDWPAENWSDLARGLRAYAAAVEAEFERRQDVCPIPAGVFV